MYRGSLLKPLGQFIFQPLTFGRALRKRINRCMKAVQKQSIQTAAIFHSKLISSLFQLTGQPTKAPKPK